MAGSWVRRRPDRAGPGSRGSPLGGAKGADWSRPSRAPAWTRLPRRPSGSPSQERDLRRGSPRDPCGSRGEGDRRGPWALPRETDILSRIPLVPGPGAQWAWLWGVWLQGRGLNREWCLRPLDPCDRVQMG